MEADSVVGPSATKHDDITYTDREPKEVGHYCGQFG